MPCSTPPNAASPRGMDQSESFRRASGVSVAAERGQTLARLDSKSALAGSGRERSDSYIRAMQQKTEAKSVNDFEKLRALLNDHPWFSSHTKSQIDDVARFMKLKTLPLPGEVVYKEGDPADMFYVVKSGTFMLQEKASPEGDKAPEHKLGEWAWFGESALRFKLPREETVRMTSAAGELFTIGASEYQGIIVKEVAERERGRLGFLRSVPLLAQLTDEQVQVLSRCLVVQTFRPSEVIIEQNTRGTEFYFIEKGKVVAYQRTQKGEREIMTQVNSFGPGDYFGEGAVLHDEPRSADCVAVEDTTTLVLRRADFVDLLGGLEQIIEANFIARTLKAVELLARLTDVERAEVADHLMVERYPDQAKIILQGEKGDKLYIIKEGTVVFSRRAAPEGGEDNGGGSLNASQSTSGGEPEVETEIGRLFAGQVFGEGALLTDAPRRATATCAGPVTLLSLERDVFHRLFDQSLQDMLNRDFTKRRDLDEANRKDLLEFADLEMIDVLGVGCV
jgi:CRP-like cAMP-binding protein